MWLCAVLAGLIVIRFGFDPPMQLRFLRFNHRGCWQRRVAVTHVFLQRKTLCPRDEDRASRHV